MTQEFRLLALHCSARLARRLWPAQYARPVSPYFAISAPKGSVMAIYPTSGPDFLIAVDPDAYRMS